MFILVLVQTWSKDQILMYTYIEFCNLAGFAICDGVVIDKSKCIFNLQGIPKKFGKKIGDKLPDVVTLIDCNSAKWKIGLRRLNHRLWLHHGWPKFMEDHSIHVGSFLIFQYEGNSNFAVYIYDLTESEMQVSINNPGIRPEPARAEQIEVASIRSSQSKDIFQTVMLPSPSKTPKDKPFVKCGAEKTSSVIADSIMRPVLEMRDKPAPKIGVRVNADELIKNQSKCKRRLLSELGKPP